MSGNSFHANQAESDAIGSGGYGGAILYKCDPKQIVYSCTVALLNNTFVGNKASRKGGAQRYENAKFTETVLIDRNNLTKIHSRRLLQQTTSDDIRPNFYEANEAPYGADMASYPKSISYSVPENSSGARINQEEFKLTLAAGQGFKFEMAILDQEGRVYTDEDQAIAKISF